MPQAATPAVPTAGLFTPARVAQLLVVLAVAALLRGVPLLVLPPTVHSYDLLGWQHVVEALTQHQNPYAATPYLNWPPCWMLALWVLHQVSLWAGLPLALTVRLFLAGMELVTIAALWGALLRAGRPRAAWLVPLLGLAANPVCICLTVVHGNFDLLVGLWVLLAAWSLAAWQRDGRPEAWLWGAACLGLGTFTKTVPLLLAPLLAWRQERLSWAAKLLGAVLLLMPVTISLGVVFVQDPAEVHAKVLRYAGLTGSYGVTGVLQWLGWERAVAAYRDVFPLALLAVLALLAWRWSRRQTASATPLDIPLTMATLLFAIVTLGPGYGSQYFWWTWPLLLWVAVTVPGVRVALLVYAAVAIPTSLAEYALIKSHGAVWVYLAPSELNLRWSRALLSGPHQFLLRLPLFLAALGLLVTLLRHAGRRRQGAAPPVSSP
jgi:hypothetical protein